MKQNDDFNWPSYTLDYYKQETKNAYARGETFLIKDSTVEDGAIVFRDNVHDHIKRLLAHINKIKPASVIECGCGGGHNVYNIHRLFPEMNVHGFDLLASQIEEMGNFLGIREEIEGLTTALDMTGDVIDQAAEYVFTNAVMMHLSYEKAVKFARNMGKLSWKYIRITEDLGQHDFETVFKNAGVLGPYEIESCENCVMILKRTEP